MVVNLRIYDRRLAGGSDLLGRLLGIDEEVGLYIGDPQLMASKKPSNTRNTWEVDFVNVSLAKEQKLQLAKWDTSGELTSDTITRLVADGYKLSISADKAHDCVGAYLTEPANSDGIRKRCLSARGPDFFGALKSLAFKHIVVLEADWGDRADSGEQLDQWG